MDKPLRILLLEDNLSDAEIVKFELEEAGFTLTANVVSEKDEFISALQEFEPDIILSDYDLPRYNGALALADAKRLCPEVPFILITGAVSEDRAIEILTSGAKDYVMKNRINTLVPAVKRVLAEAEEHKARKKAEEELRKAYSLLETKVRERTAQLQEEVEQRKQAEETLRERENRQAFLLKLSDAIRPLADPLEIQDTITQTLGKHMGVSRAFYLEADSNDPDYVVTGRWYSIDAIILPHHIKLGPAFLNAYRQGQTVVVADTDTDPRTDTQQEAFKAVGTSSFVGVPLVKNGLLAAILAVHYSKPREWTFAEISLLQEVAERTWAAIERAKAEDALKKSEDKYRTLFNSMDEGYALLQLIYDDSKRVTDFLILEANPAEEKLTGLRGITGKWMSEIAPVEKHWLEMYENVAASGVPERVEQYSEGLNRWFCVHASRVGGAGSQLIACLFDDITERKHTEKMLQKSEAILRSVFETAPVGLCIVKNRIFQSANKAWSEICGYSESELIGHSPRMLYEKKEEYERVGRELFTNLAQRGFASVQTKHRRKNGDIRDVILTATPLHSDDISSGMALVIIEDITYRKRTEEALDKVRRLQSVILDNSTVGIAFIRNRIHEWVNPKLCELYGIPKEKLEGASTRIFYQNDESYQRQGEEIYSLFSQGKKVTLETQMRKEDGSLFWCRREGIALDPANPLEGSIWIVEDITERKRAEEALEKRIIALTKPLEDTESIAFEDLFNLSEIQRLQDMLAASWGVAVLLTRPDGAAITQPSNFTYFCEFIRNSEMGCRNCQISDAELGRYNPFGPIIHKCLSAGLWGAGASITVGGRHIANWLIGQVRNEAQSEEEMMEYARKIGVEETAFRKAFLEVPVMSQEKFEQIAHALFALANQLSDIAYQNTQQARFIADLKQAEASLRESETKYRRLHESMTEAFVRVDMKGHILESNNAYRSMLGYSEEELSHLTYSDITPEKWHTFERSIVDEQILAHGASKVYEKEYQRKDGSIFPVEVSAFLIRDDAGHPAGIWGIARDITDRKRAEEALEISKEALHTLSAYNRSLIEASIDPLVTIGTHGKIMDVNAATEAATGYAREELIGKDFSDYFTEPEKARAGCQEVFRKGTLKDYPLELQHRDGHVISVLYNASVYRDEHGCIAGVFAAARDITKRKQAEEALEKQSQQLKDANKELESFSYSISHDLRAPLRAIDGFSRIILKKKGAEFDEETRSKFDIIRRNTEIMGHQIDGLLELSRLGRKALTMLIIDMENLIREVWEEIVIINPERKISLAVKQMPQGFGDRQLIRQVYSNLLSNAVKFTKKRDVAIIEAGGFTDNEKGNVYYVKDNGAGFDMAYYDKLFGVFQRLHSAEEFEGTGIGLATVQRIINKHGGRVWAKGEVDEGAVFFFSLPLH